LCSFLDRRKTSNVVPLGSSRKTASSSKSGNDNRSTSNRLVIKGRKQSNFNLILDRIPVEVVEILLQEMNL
jgi:hypothetical protein